MDVPQQRCLGKPAMTAPSHSQPDEDWLQAFLNDSIRRNLCTKIMCTTCGALEFRTGLMASLARATAMSLTAEIDLERAHALASALTHVSPIAHRAVALEEAVRLILFEMWRMIGATIAEGEIEPVLAGSWAGEVLARMKAHDAVRRNAQRLHAENELRQQQQRAERRRLRQEKHAERLARKKERDRPWRGRQGNGDS